MDFEDERWRYLAWRNCHTMESCVSWRATGIMWVKYGRCCRSVAFLKRLDRVKRRPNSTAKALMVFSADRQASHLAKERRETSSVVLIFPHTVPRRVLGVGKKNWHSNCVRDKAWDGGPRAPRQPGPPSCSGQMNFLSLDHPPRLLTLKQRPTTIAHFLWLTSDNFSHGRETRLTSNG